MARVTAESHVPEPQAPAGRTRRRLIRRLASFAGALLLCALPARAAGADRLHDVGPHTGPPLYVSDYGNNRVVTLPADGGGQTTLSLDGLVRPTGLAWDRTGSLYVSDTGNNRVVRSAPDGSGQSTVPAEGLSRPWAWPSAPPATSTSPTVSTTAS